MKKNTKEKLAKEMSEVKSRKLNFSPTDYENFREKNKIKLYQTRLAACRKSPEDLDSYTYL